MLKYEIHYSGKYEDSVVIEGETIPELVEMAFKVIKDRNWEKQYCWSESLDD